MTDPAAFAQAGLDEDEATALSAWGVEWDWRYVARPFGKRPSIAHTVHIARHDPERVLREVEAGRRILARHWNCGTGGGWCDGVGLPVDAPCPDMADLLVRWAGDPGYDQKWKPAGEGSADG